MLSKIEMTELQLVDHSDSSCWVIPIYLKIITFVLFHFDLFYLITFALNRNIIFWIIYFICTLWSGLHGNHREITLCGGCWSVAFLVMLVCQWPSDSLADGFACGFTWWSVSMNSWKVHETFFADWPLRNPDYLWLSRSHSAVLKVSKIYAPVVSLLAMAQCIFGPRPNNLFSSLPVWHYACTVLYKYKLLHI